MISARKYLANLISCSPEKKLPRKEIMRIMMDAGYTSNQVQYAGMSDEFQTEWGPRNISIWSLRKRP